jgi:formylmethanofuran dehydrogenase subunit E
MTLDEILRESASRHRHLCPRQVLGARMVLYAAEWLGFDLPRANKHLLVISETDGCAGNNYYDLTPALHQQPISA